MAVLAASYSPVSVELTTFHATVDEIHHMVIDLRIQLCVDDSIRLSMTK